MQFCIIDFDRYFQAICHSNKAQCNGMRMEQQQNKVARQPHIVQIRHEKKPNQKRTMDRQTIRISFIQKFNMLCVEPTHV